MSEIAYRIYPSLLDGFQEYLEAEATWEKYWGGSDEPSKNLDEYLAEVEQELIDKINRVPHDPIEAADKGTCFNEIVDCIIEHRKCGIEGMEILSDKENGVIGATYHGFRFQFDIALCKDAAKYFDGAMTQHFCRAELPTRYGTVELYGYADEIVRDEVKDIKTTTSYEYGKFSKKFQKDVYPYCLIESGEMDSVSQFEYTVFLINKASERNPVTTGRMYREKYPYEHEKAAMRLKNACEHFIEWLNSNKDKITDKKIFGK